MKILLVIPARYASTRLPGKPLVKINGIEMIRRVASIADAVCRKNENCDYLVATDDDRIIKFCNSYAIPVVMTPENCKNGTERCFEAVSQQKNAPELVINLQGDNPLCPPHIIQLLIEEWNNCNADVYTPCVQLNWDEYEHFAASKKETPFSGTSVISDQKGYALAFSKNIIPAIRDIDKAKYELAMSPVRRHIGLYAYTFSFLQKYTTMASSLYEQSYIEGLEQMRFLDNGYKIKTVEANYRGRETASGVDSPEDIVRVESILNKFGELDLDNF